MKLRKIQVLTYSQLIGYDDKTAVDFIKRIPIEKRLLVAPFLTGINLQKSALLNPNNLIPFWFNKDDSNEMKFALQIFKNFKKLGNSSILSILNGYSSLKLLEIVNSDVMYEKSEENIHINLMKAYLKINEEYISRYDHIALETTEKVEPLYKKGAAIYFSRMSIDDYSNADINKVVATQWIKAIYLFEFLSSKPEAKPIIELLLSRYNVASWQDYLKKLMGLVKFVISNQNTDTCQVVNFEDNVDTKLYDDYTHLFNYRDSDLDFISIRNKPLIKVGDKSYKFLFDLFVAEKLFNGQYWLLKDLNNSLEENARLEIRKIFTHEFSEKTLLYDTINYIFPKHLIHFSGEILETNYDGACDYYLRDRDLIYLFESKDIFLSAQSKVSGNFDLLHSEINKKLNYDENDNSRKAIKQLTFNIEYILNNTFDLDTALNLSKAIFVPIIVVHSRVFNIAGLNVLLNYMMKSAINESTILYKHRYRILGVNLIDIDTLIFNRDLLRKGRINLFDICKRNYETFKYFNSKTKVKRSWDDVEKSFLCLADQMEHRTNRRWKRSPEQFIQKSLSLFK